MRKLIASTFVSLDGVLQAPGAADEDPSGGFTLGGWSFHHWDEVMAQSMSGFDAKDRELVLGRKTYQIFEAHWPYQPADDPVAQNINGARKHVASRTLATLDWHNATLLGPDVVAAVAALKRQPGLDLQVIGSGGLLQALHAAGLVDEYNVWTFPVVLGRGKRLFETGTPSRTLRLVRSQASGSGVLLSTYVPAGPVVPGSFATGEPSAKEQARRTALQREARPPRPPLLSHVFIGITQFERAWRFYSALMQGLGAAQRFCDAQQQWAGWQAEGGARPLLVIGRPFDGQPHQAGNGQMTALSAADRATVRRAHATALAHGGSDEGAPGLRPDYHPHYYGAYFRDPDGNKLCVVCHAPEG